MSPGIARTLGTKRPEVYLDAIPGTDPPYSEWSIAIGDREPLQSPHGDAAN